MYKLPDNIYTRWASMENPDGTVGAGGKANFGRKGAACKAPLAAGETFTMAHAEGTSGVIRRMWITIPERSKEMMRGLVLRMYWDGRSTPAVEAPLGDFFCQPIGEPVVFENAWFDNPEGRSFNARIPMPFKTGFKITVTNDTEKSIDMFFYDVNYTIGDTHDENIGYFHSYFRRDAATKLREDFEILPKINGKGRFLGCSMGIISNMKEYKTSWWGEGEVKMYIDGDTDYPTLCGTGTEDYIATAWGQGQYACMWHGCNFADSESLRYSFYRLHGPDPVYFYRDIKVTIQQIGCYEPKDIIKHIRETGKGLIATGDGNRVMDADKLERGEEPPATFERSDDWSATSYLYINTPKGLLPEIMPYKDRIVGLI